MSDGENEAITALVIQAKSNDVDTKVDALIKLQQEFDRSSEIDQSDAVIATLKACLRTSNTHLYIAALNTISSFLASLDSDVASMGLDLPLLRQLVVAFVPAGGVIDRLGDAREKPRDKARDILVRLSSMCFKACGTIQATAAKGKDASKAAETPLAVLERHLREVGLMNKLWRVREQSILALVHIRRLYPMFPIRPYLQLLVKALQDPDAAVRDCARKSIIEIFTGMGVSDAARADLKREMEKVGIRATTMGEILADVIGKNSATPAATESQPPSAPSRLPSTRPIVAAKASGSLLQEAPETPVATPAADVEIAPVYVASSRDLENEFQKMATYFQDKETEHNWADREKSIIRLRSMLRGGVHDRYHDVFLSGLKHGMLELSYKTLLSLRTTVASQTCFFYVDLITHLGTAADPFAESMLNQLLRIAGYTKKIMANQSQQAVTAIIQNTSCQPRATLTLLWQTIQEKTPAARGFAVGHIKVFLETHGQSSRQLIEASGHLETLEKCIYKGLVDPSPIVKEPSRHCFWSFHTIWPERGKAVLAKLDPVGRKQLEKLSPDPSALAGVPQVTTESKKPSVAAAIAANRAKAKQIAAAPPTLRHQATSTAHNTPRGPSSGIPPRERRTPSTTMLPPSPEASPRATPSPPLSASASKFRLDSRSPPPAQMRRVPKSPSPPAPIQRPRVASRGGLVSTPKIQRKAPLASTPSAKSDAAQSTAPSSPLSQASDSLADQSFNLLSFASPVIPPTTSRPPLSVNPVQEPDPAIEEELRATSAQAEAAAQQLLDISRSPQIAKRSLLPEPSSLPETPVKNPEVKKRLDTFQNSPFSVREPSQLALLTDRPQLSWWFKIKKKLEGVEPPSLGDAETQIRELKRCISALDQCIAEMRELRSLIWVIRKNPTPAVEQTISSSASDTTIISKVWLEPGLFDSLLDTLLRFLLTEKEETRLQGGLILLYEIVENQAGQINGLEMRIYETLMAARNSEDKAIFEATTVIRDVLGGQIYPLYGLTTLYTQLRDFLKASKSESDLSVARSHVFGLIGIAKFILRLPAEILEDELTRMRPLILESLVDANSAVREAASMVVVAAQIVLQDQAHLFTLLDGLSEEKKNFLTYIFSKNDVQNVTPESSSNQQSPQMQRVKKEMQKLDERLNPR